MIFLVFLCLVRFEAAVGSDSEGVAGVTTSRVRRIAKPLTPADPRFDDLPDRLLAESMLSRFARSAGPESNSLSLSTVRRYALLLLDSPWVDQPISKYLTTVVIPGIVVNHGKIADLGRLNLIAISHSNGDDSQTNLTVFHGNLKTSYKYNLDGPKGRLEVKAPGRIYSVSLTSKTEGDDCITKISDLALEKEDNVELTAHGESSEGVDPYVKFLDVLITESRRTAYFNIRAALEKKLRAVKPPFCQDIS